MDVVPLFFRTTRIQQLIKPAERKRRQSEHSNRIQPFDRACDERHVVRPDTEQTKAGHPRRFSTVSAAGVVLNAGSGRPAGYLEHQRDGGGCLTRPAHQT